MENNQLHLSYQQTGYFSKLVADYVSGNKQLQNFYKHSVNIDGIKAAIAARQTFATNRHLLVNCLTQQYQNIALTNKQIANLQALKSNTTFTITTAHQPNIFTGPLYFIYKIIHAIKLADDLQKQLPEFNFVPVYYMGSEDADLDELGYLNLGGEKLVWNTKQTGAVGRMLVDKALQQIITNIQGQIGIHSFGNQLIAIFNQCYTLGKTIQQATLELVNTLFADYGLLVVVPDNAALKASFNSVVTKEITEQFSHKAVAETIAQLSEHYKVQAGGRELNLFYLLDDKRERIEFDSLKFRVQSLGLEFSNDEILQALQNHPERFSANVILRGVFQETILPNIAFIGGGGELAYWLELQKVFQAVNVPYPMLILRNSLLFVTDEQIQRIEKLGFAVDDFFKKPFDLINALVRKNSGKQLDITAQIEAVKQQYQALQAIAENIDESLKNHTEALQTKALKPLHELEKKLLRKEKKRFEAQQRQIEKLKAELFPNNSLQERVDNFSYLYAKYGKDWLQTVYNQSLTLEQQFTVVKLPK
ncbi:MAG: bacillithiol biosynthesis cysteine-adding enzyme BshC [Flavobacterium sp.]|nr:bacillithiol biosynthesis cysteine-adding enzyme BshC [Flavobacterium sp.]